MSQQTGSFDQMAATLMHMTSHRIPEGQLVGNPRDPFRPSGHTGLLLSVLWRFAPMATWQRGFDMGVGSGAVLGMLGRLGVQRLYGVDVDPEAISATSRFLTQLGLIDQATLLVGSLWEPIGDETFDVIASNLPQFAAAKASDPEHSAYWSYAGPDGRLFMDPFLAGLRRHMHHTSVAYITHNRFLGMERTEAVCASSGLVVREVMSSAVLLHPQKAALLQSEVRGQGDAAGIMRLGPYEFIDVQILEIRPQEAV